MGHIVVLSTALRPDVGGYARHPLAGLNGGIPVLWNLFFESRDLARDLRTVDGEPKDVVFATVKKTIALERLEQRVLWYCELLGAGVLAEYAALLTATLARTPGEYLTMDLSHVAARGDPASFFTEYALLLDRLSEAFRRSEFDARLRQDILLASGYDSSRSFPPARLLLDIEHPPWEETQDHARVIGASWTGSLAWERAATG